VAPIGLLILRLLQGFGLGGEYGGGMVMMVEHAPPERRGFYSSLVHIGTPAGFLLPVAIIGFLDRHMSPASFLAWGWRLPFLGSAALVLVALFIRFRISESPAFRRMVEKSLPARIPSLEAIRDNWKQILLGIFAKNAESGLFNVYAVFSITYGVTKLHLPRSLVLNGILLACLIECATLPLFGALADRLGRKAVYVGGALFQAALAIPFFAMLDTGNPAIIWTAIALGFGVGHGAMYGAQGAFFSELFPARTRYNGLSLVLQIGAVFGGGLSPLIGTLLLMKFHSTWEVSCYMIAISILSAAAAMALKPQQAAI
jgi:MFS family permease